MKLPALDNMPINKPRFNQKWNSFIHHLATHPQIPQVQIHLIKGTPVKHHITLIIINSRQLPNKWENRYNGIIGSSVIHANVFKASNRSLYIYSRLMTDWLTHSLTNSFICPHNALKTWQRLPANFQKLNLRVYYIILKGYRWYFINFTLTSTLRIRHAYKHIKPWKDFTRT